MLIFLNSRERLYEDEKFVALVSAILMLGSLSVPVLAEEGTELVQTDNMESVRSEKQIPYYWYTTNKQK